jgi:hypothetical protein
MTNANLAKLGSCHHGLVSVSDEHISSNGSNLGSYWRSVIS